MSVADKNSYYSLNRVLLQICGVWPYDKTKHQYLRSVFIFVLFIVYLIYQFVPLFTYKFSFKLFLRVGSNTLPVVLCSLQFVAFFTNRRDTICLLDQLFKEWETLKDLKEIGILRNSAEYSKKLNVILLLLGWVLLLMIYVMPIVVNRAANVTMQNNDSTDDLDFDRMVYFVILLVGAFVMTSTSAMALSYMRHVCAMLKITCYRFEHSLDANRYMSIPQKERLMFRKLSSAVDVHRRTLRMMRFALSSLKHIYFLLIVLGVASFAVNLLQAIQSALILDSITDLVTSSFYVPIHIIYFFVLNYGGQIIIDHDIDVFRTLYSIQWYVAPVRVQKFILFLMLKYTRSFNVVIGGIYVASMEGFVTLTSMSMSYFTVIYSTQR